jgi:glycosyltransferase involved in cell wall biosynthesis
MTPRVSVVIPAHNAERFLGQAIDSALAQDHPDVEVIVVDDGSTDRTAEIAEAHPQVRCLRQDHQGPGAARNAGAAAATGEFVAFLDADDLLKPESCSTLAAHLGAHPQIGVLLSRHEILLEGVEAPDWLVPDSRFGDPGGQHVEAAIVRRRVFLDGGGFDPTYQENEGIEWLSRLRRQGIRIDVLDAKLHHYRIHEGNVNAGWVRRRGTLRALRARIAENRGAS